MDSLGLFAAFTVGLLGSSHCLAMCGGIGAALGVRSSAQGTLTADLALYALGRVSAYALLGLIAGSLGAGLLLAAPKLLFSLRLLSGGLLVAMGLYVMGLWHGLRRLERVGARLFTWARKVPLPQQGPLAPLLMGGLWGLLPCGLVYSALALALSSGNGLQGALLMAAFGLGTVPAVTLATWASAPVAQLLRQPRVRWVAGAAIMLFGFWTLSHPGPGDAARLAPNLSFSSALGPLGRDCHDCVA
ncbi:MAG: sulfite exporter TauE/SafE family protein [Pseudomonadales bacterium]|nr:sulfite exporter TauE/SafE family protein [Pseudomonadales bacterium]